MYLKKKTLIDIDALKKKKDCLLCIVWFHWFYCIVATTRILKMSFFASFLFTL